MQQIQLKVHLTTSFASNYDSSEGYTPYTSANSGDVISSDTDTFWKGTFAGEVLDLSDYTDKTTGADYSFSSDHIEIGIDGDYFTVTDQSKARYAGLRANC